MTGFPQTRTEPASPFIARNGGRYFAIGPAYQRGVKYLLSTQRADGSWYVASHSPRIQAFFEGGFPHHYDQWISNWGTSWSAMALSAAIETPVTRAAK